MAMAISNHCYELLLTTVTEDNRGLILDSISWDWPLKTALVILHNGQVAPTAEDNNFCHSK